MEELIKTNVLAYAFTAAFAGVWIFLIIYGIFKKTRKTVLRFGISGVLVFFWLWFFVYTNLFPVLLAYYEYNHNIVEEKTGIIEKIEQNGKDRMNIVIDNTEYTMVHSSVNPAVIIGTDIDKGDTVKFEFGVRSKYIFDICNPN